MLEIMVSCSVLVQFKHESLFPWTQICIKYYRENPPDEKHVFQLPVSSALVKKFYQDHPEVWKVDISSGHGPKEVKTTWQVSTNPPVEHMMSNNTDLKKELDGSCVSGNRNGMEKIKCDTEAVDSSIKSIFSERGDLDFAEQLWCKMKCVSSYQELIACFTLVLESLECGEIQPWIHHGSGSLLSKLIQQSYHGKMEAVSLTGITPVQMLLEIGLDKMKKDYVNFFIGMSSDSGRCWSSRGMRGADICFLKRCFPGFSTKNGVLTVANQTTFNDGRGKTRNITDLREAAE
ncbi:protein zwilch homolog isoform 5-T17 [Amazona ochrocephala]